MTIPKPWPPERRARVLAKIVKESERTAARLGAAAVVIVAFYEDGEYLHMQDGGKSPVPYKDIYRSLLTATEMNEAAGGKDLGFMQ